MGGYMKELGEHARAETESGRDINHRFMATCRNCHTTAHAPTEAEAEANLAKSPCVDDCQNCNNLRHSGSTHPAVPHGGSCNTVLYICPFYKRRWWQSNTHYHLWQQVTSDKEWEILLYDLTHPQDPDDAW